MRRKQAQKRQVTPDPKFKDKLVARLINVVMIHGKKPTAEKIVYGALDSVANVLKTDPKDALHEAIDIIKPSVMVRSRRVGGATYQVPMEVRPQRQVAIALRWLVEAARSRKEPTMMKRLAQEIIAASQGEGGAKRKQVDTHKMAEANKAFAHFRF